MGFFANLLIKSQLDKFNTFIWNTNKNNFDPIINIKTINLDLIIGIERQKKTLLENTENFALGNFTNNALLWGSRGNGKSTLIKSIFIELSKNYKNLKLIQLNKNDIFDIESIYKRISKYSEKPSASITFSKGFAHLPKSCQICCLPPSVPTPNVRRT